VFSAHVAAALGRALGMVLFAILAVDRRSLREAKNESPMDLH